jgi:hypothetical protein
MKVKELIAKLATEDPEADVHIPYDYGDSTTIVAPQVERVEECAVRFSDRLGMPVLANGDEASALVVVLR